MKNETVVWNVYVEDINAQIITTYNIFDHYSYVKDLQKLLKSIQDKTDEFVEDLRRTTRYYFWSKCEWEVMITSLFDELPYNKVPKIKIDVFKQIQLNWNIFVDFVWNNKDEILKIKV